jgi:dTDP-alpha-D-glucuronic acid decarboxylase
MSAAKVVVTGGCGFVGGHLVERLVARGDDVTVFDTAQTATGASGQARFVPGDILAPDTLARAIKPGVDVVYHLAAVVGVDEYLARPLDVIDINFTGTRNVLEAARAAGARIVVASTSEIFGKNSAVPWREDDDRVLGSTSADRWSYSTSKALTEHLVFAFARQYGMEAAIIRFFNVYGPRQRPAFLISRSVHRALNGLPPVVYDAGRQTRCFTYVEDAVEGAVLAGTHPRAGGEVFNIGSMTETPVGDAIRLVAELTGMESELRHISTEEHLGKRYEDLPRRIPHNGKARELLGWSCPTELRDGIAKTIDWARGNAWWLRLPDSGAA